MIEIMSTSLPEQFEHLPAELLELRGGDHVFRRDGAVHWLHFVLSGTVHLRRYKADGGITVLQRAEAGYFLAEASLFSPAYHCDAIVITDAQLARFPKCAVLNALKTNPEFALGWAQYLSREVQRTRSRAELLSLRRLSERMDAWMELRDGDFPEKGQWVSVAREIGVSPEALYRYLAGRRGTHPAADGPAHG